MGSITVKGEEPHFRPLIASFIKHASVTTVLELGVCTGRGARVFLEAVGREGKVWGVDNRYLREAIDLVKADWPNWEFIVGDDLAINWTQPVDLLLVDSDHTYQHVLDVLLKYAPYIKHWIFLHDSADAPVVSAIERFVSLSNYSWAWAEWYHENGLALLIRL